MRKLCVLLASFALCCCSKPVDIDMYQAFRNPDNTCRPSVRWWWNGDKLSEKEILRELDIMQAAGIGGVEINPIRFPDSSDSIGIRTLEWLSPEWIGMLKVAMDGCEERGMTCDMIVGSGWPFGSEYLSRDRQLQLLTVETFDIGSGQTFSMSKDEILSKVNPQIMSKYPDPEKTLVYLRLLPKRVSAFTPGEDYDSLAGNEIIELTVPDDGDYVLYCFVKLNGFMAVINGAPGAQGPVMNHFDKETAEWYLNRLSDAITPVTGKMGDHMRAAFCDSFETEGSNWDDNMRKEFRRRRGYDISPYLPYVIYKVGHMGNPVTEKYGSDIEYDEKFADLIERVRNDFETTQREVFHDGFLAPYIKWCHKNGLKARIQAYGRGLHPVESSMYLDIPECESWLSSSVGQMFPEYGYNGGRGYSMINKYVTSGALLSGNNTISCEEQTNTSLVFNSTLEKIKVVGDMSNLSGVNHSILHGFNYSPVEVPFPGWVQYGTFFNERNTWWRHFRLWSDYKARLSSVFQNAVLQSDIAILPPLEDMWSKLGGQRDPYPTEQYPFYAHNLWEVIHQSGSGCDYISEMILEKGKVRDGRLVYNGRSYSALLLMEVESLTPAAAGTLLEFAEAGGRIICLGKKPWKSHGLVDAEKKGRIVRSYIEKIESLKSDNFTLVDGPSPDGSALDWFLGLRDKFGLERDVIFSDPDKYVSQNHYSRGDADIFFIVNYNQNESRDQRVSFPKVDAGRTAWLWDAETGERYMLGDWADGIDVHLDAADAKLIVFDDVTGGQDYAPVRREGDPELVLDGNWTLSFRHGVTGETFETDLSSLYDLSTSDDRRISAFAGDIDYTISAEIEDSSVIKVLDAGETNGSVVELFVNGRSAGIRWHGDRLFDCSGLLKDGENIFTLRVTTVLGNYTRSLVDNPAAMRWMSGMPAFPMGLEGPVCLY